MSSSRLICVAVVMMMAAGCAAAPSAAQPRAAETVAASTVKVYYHLRYDEGEAPEETWYCASCGDYHRGGGAAAEALSDRRPLVRVGYLVAQDIVFTEDIMIDDRFLEFTEVEAGGRRIPAVQYAFALLNHGVFLRLAAPVEKVAPLTFDADQAPPFRVVAARVDGEEMIFTEAAVGEEFVRGRFGERLEQSRDQLTGQCANLGPVMGATGAAAGFFLSPRMLAKGDWAGSPLDWPKISRDEFELRLEGVREAAQAGILQVTINLRTRPQRRHDRYYWRDDSPSEMQAAGLVMDSGRVLVLAQLTRRDTARIESMTVSVGDQTHELRFEGTLADYGIIVASLDGQIDCVRPLELWEGSPGDWLEALFVANQLDFSTFARDEKVERGRFLGIDTGFKGLLWPSIHRRSGVFLFDLDARLASVPVIVRPDLQMSSYDPWRYRHTESTVCMPAGRLAQLLSDLDEVIDRSYAPLDEEESKKLVWLGVETQPLDANLAREKGAALATKGGTVGALVVHVYDGSPGARAGVQTGDILLRMTIPGQKRPVNMGGSQEGDTHFPWSQLDQVPDMYFDQLPRPWSSRENELTKFLTEVGRGKSISIEAMRNGDKMMFETTLEMAPRDFDSAEKLELDELGMTINTLTYDVRRYFQLGHDAPGVIISEIKPGSRASVANLKPYEIITAVNSAAVADIHDFEHGIREGGDVSFTVRRMSHTRMVQVYLRPSEPIIAPEAADEAAGPEGEAPSNP